MDILIGILLVILLIAVGIVYVPKLLEQITGRRNGDRVDESERADSSAQSRASAIEHLTPEDVRAIVNECIATSSELANLKAVVERQQRVIEDLTRRINSLETPRKPVTTTPFSQPVVSSPVVDSRTVYVQNTNDPEGFMNGELTDSPGLFTKLKMSVSDSFAHFIVMDTPDVQSRLLNAFGDIAPFVEKLNESVGASRIVTVKPGALALVGDKWIVKTKAKIRFE